VLLLATLIPETLDNVNSNGMYLFEKGYFLNSFCHAYFTLFLSLYFKE